MNFEIINDGYVGDGVSPGLVRGGYSFRGLRRVVGGRLVRFEVKMGQEIECEWCIPKLARLKVF